MACAVRTLQHYLQLIRKWETEGALAAGLPEFVVDRFYATQPSQAMQAVLALAAADASVLPWVNTTLLRWRTAAAPPVQANPEKLSQ